MSETETVQQRLHRELRDTSEAKHKHDYFLFTDGAGWTDPYTGFFAIACNPKTGFVGYRAGGHIGSTTERAEFEALLLGLQMIHEKESEFKTDEMLLNRKPLIYWVSDRESLVLCVGRKPDGQPYYKRRSTPDLWARFEWYERRLAVTPVFTTRENISWHKVADTYSSDLRETMKLRDIEYSETFTWLKGYPAAWQNPGEFVQNVTQGFALLMNPKPETAWEDFRRAIIAQYGEPYYTVLWETISNRTIDLPLDFDEAQRILPLLP